MKPVALALALALAQPARAGELEADREPSHAVGASIVELCAGLVQLVAIGFGFHAGALNDRRPAFATGPGPGLPYEIAAIALTGLSITLALSGLIWLAQHGGTDTSGAP